MPIALVPMHSPSASGPPGGGSGALQRNNPGRHPWSLFVGSIQGEAVAIYIDGVRVGTEHYYNFP